MCPGGTITYDICYDNLNNEFPVTGARIVDTLSPNVTYDGADPEGTVTPGPPTKVTWELGNLAPNAPSKCIKLVLRVKKPLPKGTTEIGNSCNLEDGNGEILDSETEFTPIKSNCGGNQSGSLYLLME